MRCWVLGMWFGNLIVVLASTAEGAAANSAWSLRVWQSDEGLPDNAVVGIGQRQRRSAPRREQRQASLVEGVGPGRRAAAGAVMPEGGPALSHPSRRHFPFDAP